MLALGADLWFPDIAGGGAPQLPLSAYALALDFKKPEFWAGGVKYASLAAMPGYAYARTGQQGAQDAAGAVQWFAANVPPINSAGFHAYDALTNQLGKSQNLSGLTLSGITVAEDSTAGPDGTVTADKLAEAAGAAAKSLFVRTPALAVGTVNTASVYLKAAERRYAYLRILDNGGNSFAAFMFDLQLGAFLGQNVSGAGISAASGYALPAANGWVRCIAIFTTNAVGGPYCCINLSDTPTPAYQANGDYAYPAIVGAGVYAWQFQALGGAFPGGGPLIITPVAAAVGIGASALALSLANGNYKAKYTLARVPAQTIPTVIAAGVFTHAVAPPLNGGTITSTLVNP